MKKKLSFFLIACMLFSLTACSSSSNGADAETREESQVQPADEQGNSPDETPNEGDGVLDTEPADITENAE